jgi:hypothetical protein
LPGKNRESDGDRGVDLGGTTAGNAADDKTGGRVVDGLGLLGQDLDGAAVDPVGQDRERRGLRDLGGHCGSRFPSGR